VQRVSEVPRLVPEYCRRLGVFLTFEENVMFRRNVLGVIVACGAFAAGGAGIHGGHRRRLMLGVADPNSVAIVSPRDDDRNWGSR
jgi:hypothetical protein